MKFLIVLMALAVGINASPAHNLQKNINKEIRFIDGLIEELVDKIVEAGLDPYYLAEAAYSGEALDGLVSVNAGASEVLFTGLSNIVINELVVEDGTLKFLVDVSIPELALSVGNAAAQVSVAGREIEANGRGKLAINQPRVMAVVDIAVGLSGITVNDLDVELSLGGIDSDVEISILGRDISEQFNRIVGQVIPDFLARNKDVINSGLNTVLRAFLERFLGNKK